MEPNPPPDHGSESDPNPPAAAAPGPAEPLPSPQPQPASLTRLRLETLESHGQFLETLLALTITALILLSLGVNIFMFKQMRQARGQLASQRALISSVSQEFHKKREPMVRNLIAQLQAFASTNADFRPVLEKYREDLGKYFKPAPPSSSTPVPVSPPKTN